jgi:hypothetical protein
MPRTEGRTRSVRFVDEAFGGQLEEVFVFEPYIERPLPTLHLDLDNDNDGAMGSDIVSALLANLDWEDQ